MALLILFNGYGEGRPVDAHSYGRVPFRFFAVLILPFVIPALHSLVIISAFRLRDFCRNNGEARLIAVCTTGIVFLIYGLALWRFAGPVTFRLIRGL
jgi:hypothetical protein